MPRVRRLPIYPDRLGNGKVLAEIENPESE